jgi:hypothetical protein
MYNLRIFSIKTSHTILLFLIALLFGSCEREMTTEIISTTPPELHVIVHKGADKTIRVEGATVKLFATAEDRTGDKNLISSAVTNSSGEAIFTQDKFRKGTLYLSATKDAVTILATTPYLLQNDGITLFWVSQ